MTLAPTVSRASFHFTHTPTHTQKHCMKALNNDKVFPAFVCPHIWPLRTH